MKNKLFLGMIGLLGVVLLFHLLTNKSTAPLSTDTEVKIEGKITDQEAAQAAFHTLTTNLQAVNDEDADLYITTLVSTAKEETKKEMQTFFDDYDLENTLLSFKVLKQEKNHMLVETQQKTINKGKKDYRDHIAEAHHTFVKENGKWVIEETNMTNTHFI
ncbi:hypothetical protein IV487_05390 [Enterococcus saccharolyticus]|uniref:Uncharacterized protein n=1 Tax=Candidatus Enterococcus willemsii TaxID=1857215 RepID=A0ABQ6YXB5_9ENTE|nr:MULTISPECIES: hypothetical protein [Enterococcus]KAF1302114.1 hypothetical protein BAU17_01710 [Enterococcus sp. CU12B]MCD5001907.1 hypothetical protein [Enterococcus saccharolyticus]